MADFELTEQERRLFLDEVREHLEHLEAELLEMERAGATPDAIAAAFRSAHTIKGSAATAGLADMAALTHALESVFDRLRAGELSVTPDLVADALAAVDALAGMTDAFARGQPLTPASELVERLQGWANLPTSDGGGEPSPADPTGRAAASPPAPSGTAAPAGAAWRVEARLDPACPMPAVRALQLVLELGQVGTVMATDPSLEAIESERVGDRIVAWLGSGSDGEELRRVAGSIPDLLDVRVEEVAQETAPSRDGTAAPIARGEPRGGSEERTADRTVRIDVALLDTLMNLVGELVTDRSRLAALARELRDYAPVDGIAARLEQVAAHLDRTTSQLEDAVMAARMLPIERAFRKVPRIVRDLAAASGKEVHLVIEGQDTQLDRSILDALGDPLLHLVRNAVDHGIEHAEDRLRAGKPRVATLRLAAEHRENRVVVEVSDDGAGIDVEAVRARAVERGLLNADEARALSDPDVINLIFLPGFSTARTVTEVSGRGVGLDVVKREIERIGGQVMVRSRRGEGTVFLLHLPLTLATMRALLVDVGGEIYALPLDVVQEALRVPKEVVQHLLGEPVIVVRGRTVRLVSVAEALAVPPRALAGAADDHEAPARQRGWTVVLVSYRDRAYGLVVDRLLGDREIVVKGMSAYLGRLPAVGGVTVLDDGSLALILDIEGLLGSRVGQGAIV